MADLRQLLLGTLMWRPLVFLEVSTQNLQTGEEVAVDASQCDQILSGVWLSTSQEAVLLAIGGACKARGVGGLVRSILASAVSGSDSVKLEKGPFPSLT